MRFMKKFIYTASILAAVCCTSCQKEIDNWYSETFEYSGRFVVATGCDEYDSDNTAIEDGLEVMVYNTASNVANEIWLDFSVAGLPQKGKFKVTGTPSEALCTETTKNISSHSYYIDTDYGLAPFESSYAEYFRVPAAVGEINDGLQLYTYITLDTLKILPGVATSIGGNKADSIYLKVTLHHDYMVFESREIASKDWADPNVPEYEWVVKPDSNTPADPADWDEHWTLAGYRYTGYPEDL
jgi:Fe-S cluster assembly iron-binding protein IscA